MSDAPKYPECEKLAIVSDESQTIGVFLDWLCEEMDVNVEYDTGLTINELLAKFYDIDLNKVEEERRAILEYIRTINDD